MVQLTPFLGIDLGTSNSVAATVDQHGQAIALRNTAGDELTPSVVSFPSPGTVRVGQQARADAGSRPELTVALVKRQMGTDRMFSFHGVQQTPESLSALILRAIVDGVLPGHDDRAVPAVITVPAYFGIREREATQQAGLLAGLDVLELASEPVAAAMHYGAGRMPADGSVVVYDLGGGTFDATVLRNGSGGVQVVAVDGDMDLGGADWDRRLRDHLLDVFVDQAQPTDDPADDIAFMTELTTVAERAKRALSGVLSHRVVLRHAGRTVTLSITRSEFEGMTRDLTDRTLACLRRLLSASSATGAPAVTTCLMVGGSTRMPMIAQALRDEFGWAGRLLDPDLAVAKGAALRAAQLVGSRPAWVTPGWAAPVSPPRTAGDDPADEGTDDARLPFLGSVVPRSLGLLIQDSHDATGRRRYIEHVIHQNDPLPVEGQEITVATILDDQATVRIEVYEQAGFVESPDPEHNRRVLDGQLSGLPEGLPAGSPLQIALRLGLDGRLRLTAREPGSGRVLGLEAYIDGVLDAADRSRQAERLSQLSVSQ